MPRTTHLTNRFPQIIAKLMRNSEALVRLSAEQIAAGARARVHVDSGDLRDAIHVEPTDDGRLVIAGDDDVFYGHFEEFGAAGRSAHPFLVPAAEEQRDFLSSSYIAMLRKL
jgi:HK97 gp10 family phage protein